MFIYIPIIGLCGMFFALIAYLTVLKKDKGNERMREIAHEIHHGAMVFLKKEYQVIFIFMIVVLFVVSSTR